MYPFANRPAISAEERARMETKGTADLRGIDADVVVAVTCHLFGIEQKAFLSRRRWAQEVKARAFFVWTLRAVGDQPISYPAIGQLIERDHSTTMYLHRKAIVLRMVDPEFAAICNGVLAAYRKGQAHVCN